MGRASGEVTKAKQAARSLAAAVAASPAQAAQGNWLGTILCKYCSRFIDALDTEKVTIFYSDCRQEDCIRGRAESSRTGDEVDA